VIKEFNVFLKKHDCLSRYKENMEASLYNVNPKYYFDTFDFHKTKEGYDFWNTLKRKWLKQHDLGDYAV
jgi:hypothetical protein